MSTGRWHPDRAVAVAATSLVTLSVLFAGVRAAVGSWVPHSDSAYFTARSLDVATRFNPLLGAWSSGSVDIEVEVNNLGPLQLYLLAPFTKLAPMGGTAIGVVVVQALAVVTIAWVVHRFGGWRSVAPAMAAVALLTWVMGSEMVITPQQHQYLLLPYLCVLVSAWAAARGDRWALVPFVVAGTLVCQTHLSYPILVVGVGVPAVVGQVLAARRTGTRRFQRPWVVAGITGVVLWSPAIIDQFFGWGNLGNVIGSPGETQSAGFVTGVRIVADVLMDPRGYLRPGYGEYGPLAPLAGNLTVALFVVMWIALAAGALEALRRHRRTAAAGLAVAFFAVSAGVVDAAQLPPNAFGLFPPNYRWLWPTGALLVMGVFMAAERSLRTLGERIGPAVFGGAVVLLVAMGVPESVQDLKPDEYRERRAATMELTSQLAGADLDELDDPVVIDESRMPFGHPFMYAILTVLQDQNVEFRFDDERQARRFGEGRLSDGSEPSRLLLVHGAGASAVEGNATTLAYVDGPDPVALVLIDGDP